MARLRRASETFLSPTPACEEQFYGCRSETGSIAPWSGCLPDPGRARHFAGRSAQVRHYLAQRTRHAHHQPVLLHPAVRRSSAGNIDSVLEVCRRQSEDLGAKLGRFQARETGNEIMTKTDTK